MAEKKMTRKDALTIAIERFNPDCDSHDAEVVEVLRKMLEQVSKPRKRAEGPTKARRENEKLLATLLEMMEAKGEPVTSKWITEHVRGITTPQKATAVAKIGLDDGRLVKTKEGKVISYSLPE